MKSKQIKKILKKEGFKESKSTMSSRVKGWCSHIGEGFELSFYPWRTYSSIKGRKVSYYLTDREQDCNISYYHNDKKTKKEILKKINDCLKKEGIKTNFNGDIIKIKIDNPYSESEIKSEEERIKRIRRIR